MAPTMLLAVVLFHAPGRRAALDVFANPFLSGRGYSSHFPLLYVIFVTCMHRQNFCTIFIKIKAIASILLGDGFWKPQEKTIADELVFGRDRDDLFVSRQQGGSNYYRTFFSLAIQMIIDMVSKRWAYPSKSFIPGFDRFYLQVNNPAFPSQRKFSFRLIFFTLLLSLPILLYYGYCWGWWGRQSLLLQYLFQCSCPAASEEARYSDEVDVIVPACEYTNISLSPGGRLLYVNENKLWFTSPYLLDLQTDEKIATDLPKDPFYFLTDNLAYVSSSEGYILDWVNKKQYPIRKFASLYPDAYINGDVNLDLLAEALHAAKYVFLIHDNDAVIALAADFANSSEDNFLTGRFDIPGLDTDRVQAFLQKEGIVYQSVPESFPAEAVSPDERLIARADGIYLAETGQRILEGYSASRFYRPYSRKYFMVRGWTHDGTGVIYSKFLNPCLVETNFFVFDDYGCFFEVPQPVILLKVPEEYLLPAQRP